MIKILATSDWHLGNNFHGYDRLEEHRHFLTCRLLLSPEIMIRQLAWRLLA